MAQHPFDRRSGVVRRLPSNTVLDDGLLEDEPQDPAVGGPGGEPWDEPMWQVPEASLGREAARLLASLPAFSIPRAGPQIASFIRSSFRSYHPGELPRDPFSLALLAGVAVDEAVLAGMMTPGRFPRRSDFLRVGSEIRAAHEAYAFEGLLDDVARFHRPPPRLDQRDVSLKPARVQALATSFEHLRFESGYEPGRADPAYHRWNGYSRNRVGHAWVMRHEGEADRPWIICVHGMGTGLPLMDFPEFKAKRLHSRFGLNVVMPVLPLHGPRREPRMSRAAFLGYELLDALHGIAQAVWDVRRAVAWARSQGAEQIGLYGISLGGLVVSLLSTLDHYDFVLAGVPVVSMPDLFASHGSPKVIRRARENGILGETTRDLHRLISPLALEPLVPHDRRFIFAGVGDRMATPDQARDLWEHWDCPRIAWFAGGHVTYLASRQVDRFVERSLGRAGFIPLAD